MRNSRRLRAFVALGISAALIGYYAPSALSNPGAVASASGFEDDDGNLTPGTGFDWNSFDPVTWTGDSPYRVANKTDSTSHWKFEGLEDAAATGTDTGFAGGVKQDDFCATLKPGKAPNKDDLKRIYLATKRDSVTGDVYLNLAWVRIPQNSITASAHVGFEFNQSKVNCGNSLSTGPKLVERTGGDMLIVYDFAGGSSLPDIKLSRWLTSTWHSTGTCEVNTSTTAAGCWGETQVLTSLSPQIAEGRVFTSTGTTSDAIKPSGAADPGTVEFGEAGINLSAAHVFSNGVCTNFGNAYAVSRSSGNSSQAAMEDLVGPSNFSVSNCGSATFYKEDDLGNALSGAWFTLSQSDTYTVNTTIAGLSTDTIAAGATSLTLTDGSGLPSAGKFKLVLEPGVSGKTETVVANSRSGNTVALASGTQFAHNGTSVVRWLGTCSPSGTPATCTLPNLPFGTYTLHEDSAPTGYNPAADKSFTLTADDPTGTASDFPYTFTDSRAPITITINKKDDQGTPQPLAMCTGPADSATNCALFALYEDNLPVGAPASTNFSPVKLGSTPTVTNLAAAISTASQTTVTLASATGFTVGSFAEISDGTKTEDVKISSVSGNDLTVERGVNGTIAATSFASGVSTSVKTLEGNDPILKYCVPSISGRCTISTVYPGDYWVDEVRVPTGYGKASGLPAPVHVALGDTDFTLMDGANNYFTDPRLFKVITLVCIKSSNQLYSSSVTYDGDSSAQSSLAHLATLPSGVTEAALCGLGGATHDSVTRGSHSSSISIPQN